MRRGDERGERAERGDAGRWPYRPAPAGTAAAAPATETSSRYQACRSRTPLRQPSSGAGGVATGAEGSGETITSTATGHVHKVNWMYKSTIGRLQSKSHWQSIRVKPPEVIVTHARHQHSQPPALFTIPRPPAPHGRRSCRHHLLPAVYRSTLRCHTRAPHLVSTQTLLHCATAGLRTRAFQCCMPPTANKCMRGGALLSELFTFHPSLHHAKPQLLQWMTKLQTSDPKAIYYLGICNHRCAAREWRAAPCHRCCCCALGVAAPRHVRLAAARMRS